MRKTRKRVIVRILLGLWTEAEVFLIEGGDSRSKIVRLHLASPGNAPPRTSKNAWIVFQFSAI